MVICQVDSKALTDVRTRRRYDCRSVLLVKGEIGLAISTRPRLGAARVFRGTGRPETTRFAEEGRVQREPWVDLAAWMVGHLVYVAIGCHPSAYNVVWIRET